MPAGCRNASLLIECLHIGLGLEPHHGIGLVTSRDIEVCPESSVLLQPEFVVGLQPVDLAVFMCKPCHCPVHLVIILH